MDLRTIKYINNTKWLPHFDLGKPGSTLSDDELNESLQQNAPDFTKWSMEKLNKIAGIKPKSSLNLSGIAGKISGGVNGLIQAAGTINQISNASKATIDPNEMLMKYGTNQQSVGGISFEQQNDIDANSEMAAVDASIKQNTLGAAASGASAGAAIGSVAGPIGGAIGGVVGGIGGFFGGLFGGKSRRRKEQERLRRAQAMADNKNINNRSRATTELLQKLEAEEYGDPTSQQLFEAKDGKDAVNPITNQTYKKFLVDTPEGMMYAPQNAWGSKGEWIESGDTGSLHQIKRGPNDTARINVADNDTIYSAKLKNPETGNSIAEDVPAYATAGMLDELKLIQMNQRNMKNSKRKYMYGKTCLPGFVDGAEWLTNFVPSLSGALIGLGQYSDAKNQDVYKPDTFKANPYTQVALNDLDKLRISAYPIMQQQRAAEARAASAINQSGGLSAGQRAISRIASLNATQQNIANALSSIQQQNNAYRANAAQARLNVGNQEAIHQQAAEQWDADMYAKAHAARQQGMQMGMYNFQNALEQYVANEFKRKQFNKTYGLYAADVKNQKDYIDFLKGQNTTQNNTTNPTNNYWTSVRRGVETKNNPNGDVAFASMLRDIDDSIKNMPKVPMYNPTSLKTKPVATRPSRKVTTKSSNTPSTKKSTTPIKPQTTTQAYSQSPLVFRPSEYEYGFKNIPQMVEYNRQNALGNLSNTDAKKPKKMRRGAPKTNAEALGNLFEYVILGQQEYNKRYK